MVIDMLQERCCLQYGALRMQDAQEASAEDLYLISYNAY